jgi:site-specific DNA-methyltransferase (adenine-specific)
MILLGDCLALMKGLPDSSVDMVYLDPPFFTQKIHKLSSRTNEEYEFSDVWSDIDQYKEFIAERIEQSRRLLRETGSLFLHCDRAASHHLRLVLDEVFGREFFQSEIIWNYRRWSNAKSGLLNAHQTIYFYSKTSHNKFNVLYQEYSATTNVDQILQRRERNSEGKAAYKRNENGEIEIGGVKKGVPLTDVWDLPLLNPKASERVGYPTQKPLHLMERFIEVSTAPGDMVLDPFCGSGTTLVAAKLLNRRYIGMDISNDAIGLAARRLSEPVRSESRLIKEGEGAYRNQLPEVEQFLNFIGAIVVHRNSGIDGFLNSEFGGKPVPVRVQRSWETLREAKSLFEKSCRGKGSVRRVLIATHATADMLLEDTVPEDPDLIIVDSMQTAINRALAVESKNTPALSDFRAKTASHL